MKLAKTATVDSNDAAPRACGRSSIPVGSDSRRDSADVQHWVAMLDAELRSEDSPLPDEQSMVEVTLEFGRALLDPTSKPLQAGDSLPLDQMADEPLEVLVAGRPIARGELVTVEGRLGIRIVELLLLVLAWLAIGGSAIIADERPRERATSTLFNGNVPEVLETPFDTDRNFRGKNPEDDWSEPARSKSAQRMAGERRVESAETTATPLTPRSGTRDADRAHSDVSTVRPGWSATVLPLLFVVGLIVVGARWLKTRSPTASRGLPSEVFEVLGRKAIDARTSVVLARCGSRLLVLNHSPHGLRTLVEITDPVEVDCLAGLCRATSGDQSLVETFRSLLHKPAGSQPAPVPPSNSPPNSFDDRLAVRMLSSRTAPVPATEMRP